MNPADILIVGVQFSVAVNEQVQGMRLDDVLRRSISRSRRCSFECYSIRILDAMMVDRLCIFRELTSNTQHIDVHETFSERAAHSRVAGV
jgi:hypothetical protein